MSDLGKTDAEWLRLLREFGGFVRVGRVCAELVRRFSRERVQIVNEGDVVSATPHITGCTLSGVHYGTNTSEAGLLFVRFVANGGNWDVSIYTAAGASGLVAKATNVAASATGTLAEQNSSGLTGTVTLGATIAGDTSDDHQLRVFVDYKLEALKLFPSDGTTDEDDFSRQAWSRMLNRLRSLAAQMQATVVGGAREWALAAAGNPIARGNEFTVTRESDLISESSQKDNSGNVSVLRFGWLEELRKAMEDETTGSTQDILQRVVAAGAATFDSNNDGQGAVASHTPEQHCTIGTWKFRCVRGVGNNNGGIEEFDGDFTSSVDDTSFSFTGLRVKQTWKGPRGFGPITLTRTLSKTGDGSNLNLGAATTFSTTGERESNSDAGVLYWKIDANASNWDISFYKSSNRATGDLVAKATDKATAASSVQATAQNGSGLTITFDVGSAPVDTTEGTLDLAFFHIDNGSGGGAASVPDKFEIATTLTSEGSAARLLALLFNYKLNGISSGEQVPDTLLALVNTFPPYVAEDV